MSASVGTHVERPTPAPTAGGHVEEHEVVSSRDRSDDSGVRRMPSDEARPEDAASALPEEVAPNLADDRLEVMRADRVLFGRYSPLVRRIALRTVRSLPRTLTVDDIISAGWVGMAEAMRRRPPEMPEEQFEAYASYRIRGAILDYLRALDPLSRKLRNAARRIAAAGRTLTQRLGRAPNDEEVAAELGVTLAQYHQTLSDIQDAGFDRVDGVGPVEPQATSPSPEQLASKSELVCNVADAVEGLPERLQIVLGLHYQQECSLREIGEILGVTESRVCQLHSEALQRLRARLEGRSTRARRRRVNA